MKIIVSNNELYQATSKLIGVAQQSSNRVIFYPKDENGFYLAAGNPSNMIASVEVIATVTGFDSPVWVESAKLYSFLNAIHASPNITIINAGKRWKFSIGESSFTSNTIVDDSFTLIDLPDVDNPIRIKANEVANLSRVSMLSAKDRGVYSGTYMVAVGKHLSCMATDGFQTGMVWFETDKPFDKRRDYFVPSDSMLHMQKAINDGSDVYIYEGSHRVHFVSDNYRMICTEIAGKEQYPADRIADAMRCELINGSEYDAGDLIDKLTACSVIKDVDHGNVSRVSMEQGEESLTIVSLDNYTRMTMHVPIIRSFGDEKLKFDINPRYIQTATNLLKQLGEVSTIFVHNSEELNWVFITANGINGRFAFAKMHPQG